MDSFKEGWFSELPNKMWPGQSFSFKVEKVLHKEKTKFQDLVILKSESYGKVLVLDNVIQLTERDEIAYQEMIAHVPLFSHPQPKKVLVIGGGDGGAIREILRHTCVEEVHLCEIDEGVINACKKHLPEINQGSFDNPRVTVFIKDGFKFLKENQATYDVIVVDSSDPIGPAESLYTKHFYELCHASLKSGGVLCCQGECMWLHLGVIKEWMAFLRTKFTGVGYYYTIIPTYPCGTIGFLLSFKDTPLLKKSVEGAEKREVKGKLGYYNPKIHEASFVLPTFVKEKLFSEL